MNDQYDMFDPMCSRDRQCAENIWKIIFGIILGILLVDFLGALAWMWSGQCPTSNFYIGTITIHLLRFIFR